MTGCPFAAAQEFRRHGKQFAPSALLARLGELRPAAPAGSALAAFLDCALDKPEGRFHNRTYLALAQLERIRDGLGISPDRFATLLVADIVRHEVRGPAGAERPDERTVRTRLRHCLRFVTGSAIDVEGEAVLAELPDPPASPWFATTVAPVSPLHDEYFFIRALQAHEQLFTALADDVEAATAALRAGEIAAALVRLDHAVATMDRAGVLFRIVATMQAATFHAFREHTQGASAIQSEQYKRFELACGPPTPARLRSDAFTSVPRVLADPPSDDLTSAYLDGTRSAPEASAVEIGALDERIAAIEAAHQRWKGAHHGIAARMLGDAHGSGYTAGVPYLRACLDNRLFRLLTVERAARAA
ncbi:tryptophan 2,3-dioxygenase family protein [Pseudonocardia sp. TRM90224]|uniref:tryptophan 2,3-dioxygenase family protein n=1 Tax=Pseudonocardia sp. TRM90224 TaxID=2812678 RepID=UPI001E3B4DDD|nr:tryptophan 2,3-dioxygenase family protein [Pseudonocardia sp. TRM90224]